MEASGDESIGVARLARKKRDHVLARLRGPLGMMRGGDWLAGLNRLRDDSQARHEWVPTQVFRIYRLPLNIRY